MLEFRRSGDFTIKVFKWGLPEEKAGRISDQCCYTLIYLERIPNPIKIKYEVGKGGFIGKKKDGVYIYEESILEMFRYLYQSEPLKALLKKRTIELSKKHIEDGDYISILKRFEQ